MHNLEGSFYNDTDIVNSICLQGREVDLPYTTLFHLLTIYRYYPIKRTFFPNKKELL